MRCFYEFPWNNLPKVKCMTIYFEQVVFIVVLSSSLFFALRHLHVLSSSQWKDQSDSRKQQRTCRHSFSKNFFFYWSLKYFHYFTYKFVPYNKINWKSKSHIMSKNTKSLSHQWFLLLMLEFPLMSYLLLSEYKS